MRNWEKREMSVWHKAPVHSTSLDFSPSHPISLLLLSEKEERLKAAALAQAKDEEESDKKLDKVKHFISLAVCITHDGERGA